LLKDSEFGVEADSGEVLITRVGRLSRSTVRSAMELLRRQHGHNVKLRAIAAAVVESDVADARPRDVAPSAPPAARQAPAQEAEPMSCAA
jgi:hypothetical protein